MTQNSSSNKHQVAELIIGSATLYIQSNEPSNPETDDVWVLTQ